MKIRQYVPIEQLQVVDVICDRCQKSVKIYTGNTITGRDSNGDFTVPEHDVAAEFMSIKTSWGWHSRHFGDGTLHEADICEACWFECRKILETAGVKFHDTLESYLGGPPRYEDVYANSMRFVPIVPAPEEKQEPE